MSTIPPSGARRVATAVREARGIFLDAPVSGGERGAKEATLSIMVGGPADALERVRPVLSALGTTIVHCGDSGAGQIAKACNQLVVLATIYTVAEALVLAAAAGVDPARIREALLGGFAYSRVLEVHGQRMLDRDFQPGGTVKQNHRDASIVMATANELGVPLPAFQPVADAVDLFVERARSVRPDFRLTDANAPAIAAICRRLDGLPLALELAAARANLLSPDQILARLESRLTLLGSSRRDLPDRQRTLRGAIDWSHALLSEAERVGFRRFSVFSGGADLESLAPVLDPDGELEIDPLDLASALVDRSLLRSIADDEENRLAMLETIREYAAEQLTSSGEERLVRDRHAAHFQRLAEGSRYVLTDPRRDQILDQLDRELPNLRAALGWSLEGGDLDVGLAIASDLDDFWHSRGHLGEGRAALKLLLEASAGRPPTPLSRLRRNRIRGVLGFHGAPIKLVFRNRGTERPWRALPAAKARPGAGSARKARAGARPGARRTT